MPAPTVMRIDPDRIPVAPAWLTLAAVLLGVVAVCVSGPTLATLPLLYLAAVTPQLFSTDAVHRRLPNRLVLPAYLVLLPTLAAQWLQSGRPPVVALGGGAAYFVLMLALSVAGGMGMGDVKLSGALGLTAGMFGLGAAIAAPLFAFGFGGVAATIVLAAARGRTDTRIPFGPFMLVGCWAAVLLPL